MLDLAAQQIQLILMGASRKRPNVGRNNPPGAARLNSRCRSSVMTSNTTQRVVQTMFVPACALGAQVGRAIRARVKCACTRQC